MSYPTVNPPTDSDIEPYIKFVKGLSITEQVIAAAVIAGMDLQSKIASVNGGKGKGGHNSGGNND